MAMNYYKLENKKPVQVENHKQWKEWLETASREVKRSELPNGIIVTTEFIGQAECIDESKAALLFETMIRGGIYDGMIQQYPTWELAEEGHHKVLQLVATE
jgi:hypothetical protein